MRDFNLKGISEESVAQKQVHEVRLLCQADWEESYALRFGIFHLTAYTSVNFLKYVFWVIKQITLLIDYLHFKELT